MVNHFDVHVNCQEIEHQLQENSFITFFSIAFYKMFIKLRSIFYRLKMEALVTLPNHINYLHPNIEYMTILYFYRNLSCICY